MVEVAGFEPAVTLYKSTIVTPTTAPQTKTNPPKGGYLFGGRSETRTQETPKKGLGGVRNRCNSRYANLPK